MPFKRNAGPELAAQTGMLCVLSRAQSASAIRQIQNPQLANVETNRDVSNSWELGNAGQSMSFSTKTCANGSQTVSQERHVITAIKTCFSNSERGQASPGGTDMSLCHRCFCNGRLQWVCHIIAIKKAESSHLGLPIARRRFGHDDAPVNAALNPGSWVPPGAVDAWGRFRLGWWVRVFRSAREWVG